MSDLDKQMADALQADSIKLGSNTTALPPALKMYLSPQETATTDEQKAAEALVNDTYRGPDWRKKLDDQLSFLRSQTGTADPTGQNADKVSASLFLAEKMNQTPEWVFQNFDNVVKSFNYQNQKPVGLGKELVDIWKTGWSMIKIWELDYQKSTGVGDDHRPASNAGVIPSYQVFQPTDYDRQIASIKAKMPTDSSTRRGAVGEVLKAFTGSLPLIISSSIAGLKAGIMTASASTAALLAAEAPVAAAASLTGVGAPVTAGGIALSAAADWTVAFAIGSRVGSGVKLNQLMIGMTYDSLSEIRDSQGRELDDSIKRKISVPLGTLIGLLEGLEIRTGLASLGKPAEDLFGESVKAVVSGTILKSIGNNALRTAARAGVDLATEGIENGAQQLVQMLGENIAINFQQNWQQRGFEKHGADAIVKSVLEQTAIGAAAFSPVIVPGAIFGPMFRRALNFQTVEEVQQAQQKRMLEQFNQMQAGIDTGNLVDQLNKADLSVTTKPISPSVVKPAAVQPEQGTPRSITETTRPVERAAPDLAPSGMEGSNWAELNRRMVEDARAWQYDPSMWAKIETARAARISDSAEVGVSAYKNVFTQEMAPLRAAIQSRFPQATIEQVDGTALIMDVVAGAQGYTTGQFSQRLFAPGILATDEQIDTMHGQFIEDQKARLQAEGKTPQEIQDALVDAEAKWSAMKGVTQFMDDGKALMALTKRADLGTFIHEFGHVLRRWLPDTAMETVARWAGADGPDGWTEAAEEKWAKALTEYVLTGKVPDEKIKNVLQRFAEWIQYWMRALRSRIEISPEIEHVMAQIFSKRSDNQPFLKLEPNPQPADAMNMLFQVDDQVPIEMDPAKVPDEAFVRESDYVAFIRQQYVDENGAQKTVPSPDGSIVKIDSRTVPVVGLRLRLGQWLVQDKYALNYGHEIAQLRKIQSSDIVLYKDEPGKYVMTEDMAPSNQGGRGWDSDRYMGWMKEGLTPPPITAVENQSGSFHITDGHRRAYASMRSGTPIYAWVWPSMDQPQGLRDSGDGKVIRVGMTYEAVKGKPWVDPLVAPRFLFEIDKADQKKLNAEAVALLGLTDDPKESGYILSDGKMLDMTYRFESDEYTREGNKNVLKDKTMHDHRAGTREVDHRGVQDLPSIAASGTAAMTEWMTRSSAIRFDTASGTMSLNYPPTKSQWKTLEKVLLEMPGLYIEMLDKNGQSVGFKEFRSASLQNIDDFVTSADYFKPKSFLFDSDPAEAARFNKEALSVFGSTLDPKKAGYILSTGEMLDFNNTFGASETVVENGRQVHRLIAKALPSAELYESITRALSLGAIRMDYDPALTELQFAGKPSDAAMETIARVLQRVARVELELTDPKTGDMLAFKDMRNPTAQSVADFFNAAKFYNPKYLFDTDPWLLRSFETVRSKIKGAMPGRQIRGTLVSAGVTLDELHWMHLDELLDTDEKLRPQDVMEYITRNAVAIDERVRGPLFTADTTYHWEEKPVSRPGLPTVMDYTAMTNMEGVPTVAKISAFRFEAGVPTEWSLVFHDKGGRRMTRSFPTAEEAKAYFARWADAATGPNPQYKQEEYRSPGGTNYREITFQVRWKKPGGELRMKPIAGQEARFAELNKRFAELLDRGRTDAVLSEIDYVEMELATISEPSSVPVNVPTFEPRHFSGTEDLVGWIRTQDYRLPDGSKSLMVDEFQSEWAEEARSEGLQSIPTLQRWKDFYARVKPLREKAVQNHKERMAVVEEERRLTEEWHSVYEHSYDDPPGPELKVKRAKMAGLAEQISVLRQKSSDMLDKSIDYNTEIDAVQKDMLEGGDESALPPAPFIASRRWAVMVDGEEWTNENGQTQRFATPEEARRFLAKASLAGASIMDLGYVENTQAWAGMEFRRALRFAVENDYGSLSWTKGAVQNARWKLSNWVSSIEWMRSKVVSATGEARETYSYLAFNHDGEVVMDAADLGEKELRNHLGGRVADQILSATAEDLIGTDVSYNQWKGAKSFTVESEKSLAGPEVFEDGVVVVMRDAEKKQIGQGVLFKTPDAAKKWGQTAIAVLTRRATKGEISGINLEVGGEFMKLLYDKIVRSYAEKYVKQWGGEVVERTFEVTHAGEASTIPVWLIEITPKMRESVKAGRFQQFLMQPGDHESEVEAAVSRGDPVPDDVLEAYADRPWAKAEIDLREAELTDIQTGSFKDAEEYIAFHDAMRTPDEAPRSFEYWMMLWQKAGGDAEGGGDFTVLTPKEANKQFIAGLNNEQAMVHFINALGETRRLDPNRKSGTVDIFSHLPRAFYYARNRVEKTGTLPTEMFIALIKLIKAEPERYREIQAELGDENMRRQLESEQKAIAEGTMAPAEESRLRTENARLRAELKAYRAVEREALVEGARGKDLWQMTKREWEARSGDLTADQKKKYLAAQEDRIREAIQAGLPVPREVLDEWPSLAAALPAAEEVAAPGEQEISYDDRSTPGAKPEDTVVLTVRMSNPYKEPPAGKGFELLRVRLDREAWKKQDVPADVQKMVDENPGYTVYTSFPTRRGPKWSEEAKGRVRSGRLDKRLEKKAPLFKEELKAREVSAQPGYYQGKAPGEPVSALPAPPLELTSKDWDFIHTFPTPTEEAVKEGVWKDAVNYETVSSVHNETGYEMQQRLRSAEVLQLAIALKVQPENFEKEANEKAIQKMIGALGEERQAYAEMVASYEDAFGNEAAAKFDAFQKASLAAEFQQDMGAKSAEEIIAGLPTDEAKKKWLQDLRDEDEATARAENEARLATMQATIDNAPLTVSGKKPSQYGVYAAEGPTVEAGSRKAGWTVEIKFVQRTDGWIAAVNQSYHVGDYSGSGAGLSVYDKPYITRDDAYAAKLMSVRGSFAREVDTEGQKKAQKAALAWIDKELATLSSKGVTGAVAVSKEVPATQTVSGPVTSDVNVVPLPAAAQAVAQVQKAFSREGDLAPEYTGATVQIMEAMAGLRSEYEKQIIGLEERIKDLQEEMKTDEKWNKEIERQQAALARLEKRAAAAAMKERMTQKILELTAQRKKEREFWQQRWKQREEQQRVKRIVTVIHQLEGRVSKMHSEVQAPLRSVFNAVNAILAGRSAKAELQDLRNALAEMDDKTDFPFLDELDVMAQTPMQFFSFADMDVLLKSVLHWINYNQGLETIRIGTEAVRAAEAVTQSVQQMKPSKEILSKIESLDPTRFEKIKEKGGDIFQNLLGLGQVQYSVLTELLAGHKSIMNTVLMTQLEEGRRVELEKLQQYKDFFDFETDKVKIPNMLNWLREREAFNNGANRVELSRGEKLSLYMHGLSQDNRQSILEKGMGSRRRAKWRVKPMKVSEALFEDLAARMDQKELDFVAVVQRLMQMTGDDMSEIYEIRYGYPMPRPDNYWHKDTMPIGRGSTLEAQSALAQTKAKSLAPGLEKGRTKTRKGARTALYLNSIEYDLMETLNYAARYVGLEIPVYQASKLVTNETFVTEMDKRYTRELQKFIVQGIRDFVGEDRALPTVERVLTRTRAMIQMAFLGNNPASMLKLVLGFANAAAHVRIDHLTAGMADFMLHARRVDAFHRTFSVVFRDRVEQGFTRDIAEEARLRQAGQLVHGRYYLQRAGWAGIRWADRAAVNIAMRGAFLQAYSELSKGKLSAETARGIGERVKEMDLTTLSVEEKFDLAMRFADFVNTRTQDQHLPEYRSQLSRSTVLAGLAKFMTMFGSNTNTNLNVIVRAVNDFQKTPRAGRNAYRLMKVMGLMLVAVPFAEAMVNHLRDELLKRYGDDEEKWKTVGLTYASNVASMSFFLRDIASGVISKLQGRQINDITIPPLQILNMITKTFGLFIDWTANRGFLQGETIGNKLIDQMGELFIILFELPILMPKRYIQELIKKAGG